MMDTKTKFRAGDVVNHVPSAEQWVIASVTLNGYIYAAGWPETTAPHSDLEMVREATDLEHLAMLLRVVQSKNNGSRKAAAQDNLLALCPADIQEKRNALVSDCNEAYIQHQRALAALSDLDARICAGDPFWPDEDK